MGWKIVAIVFIIISIIETMFIAYSYIYYAVELDKEKICYYDVCGKYADALYDDSVCYCYDYDMLGNLMIVETEYVR